MGHVLEVLSESTADAAGARVAAALLAAGDRARLAIPGGSALAAMPAVLRALPERARRRLRLTWVDERCVDPDDPASNHGAARRAGLVPDDLAAALPLWQAGDDPTAAQTRVAAGLARDFAGGLDVALLGLGEDGHVASLFPGHPALQAAGPVAYLADAPKPPPRRMTLTLDCLRRAGLAVLLALGEGKRAALTRLLRRDPALPTSSLERLIVVTDLEIRA
jgi:6-phosphogluconolactonase